MSSLGILATIGAILLAAVAIYAGITWSRGRGKTSAAPSSTDAPASVRGRQAAAAEGALDPMTLGKLRSGREGDRLSEDDIARAKMGPRGKPGEQPTPPNLPENETQIPRPLDPGHTA